jgi:transmembrane sensor
LDYNRFMADNSKNIEITDILAGYFSGELTEEEVRRIESWKELSDENRKVFDEYRNLWESAGNSSGLKDIDIENEWEFLRRRTIDREARIVSFTHPSEKSSSLWLKIAASVLVVAVTGYAVYTAYFSKNTVTVLSGMAVKMISLPDGSKITLNRNSALSYNEDYGLHARNVSLTGEAFFEVAHDSVKKFTVITKLADIVVTGTAFNVTAQKDSGKVEVLVSSGTVEMHSGHNKDDKIILHQGNLGIARGNNGSLIKNDTADLNNLAWKTGLLTFENDSLGYVVRMLNKTYRSRVKFRNISLSRCMITVSFDNQSLEDILEVIKSTLGLTVIKENDTYYFEGAGC